MGPADAHGRWWPGCSSSWRSSSLILPVRIPDFFYRDLADPETGEVPLRCRDCGFEFTVPLDWADSHIGLTQRLPRLLAALADSGRRPRPSGRTEGRDGSDDLVGMTDRGGDWSSSSIRRSLDRQS